MRFGKRLLFWLMVAFTATPIYAQIGQPGIQPGPSSITSPTFTGNIDATGGVFTGTTPICMEGTTPNAFQTCFVPVDPTADRNIGLPNASGTVALLQEHEYLVDATNTSAYPTVKAALDAINAEAIVHIGLAEYLKTNYVIRIAPGIYSDNLTFLNEKHIRLEGTGVELSGTLTFTQTQQGGDYYSRVEFVGLDGFRAEKGPAFKISGAMSGTRNNDSLTYFTFKGVWITGNFTWDGDGTPVVQFFGCRMNGTIDTVTLATPDSTILVEADWTEFATGSITDKVSLYNVRNSDFYGAINTTPWYSNTFYNTGFHSTVSIIPQGGAAETTVNLDGVSFKSLAIRTPTLTGATVQNLDLYTLSPTIPDSGGAGAATYTLEPRGAEAVFLTCADADGCTVTMGEEMAFTGQKLVIVNLGANDVTLVDDDGTTAELDGDVNYVMDVQLESVTLVYTGTYWLQTGFLDPS